MTGRVVTAAAMILLLALTLVAATRAEGLEQRALAAMQEGRYDEAARLLSELLDERPGQAGALYNLACCASRQGDLERAAELVESAWQAGLRDLELIRTDPDLAALRESRRGRRLIRRLEQESERALRLHGRPLLFDAGVIARARVVTPSPMEPGRQYPLVVVLHGHGGSAENIVGIFSAAGLSPGFIVAAPAGPYTVRLGTGTGQSWYPPVWLYNEVVRGFRSGAESEASEQRRTLDQHEQDVSEAYVLEAIEQIADHYPADPERVIVLGHSEGGVLAYGLGLGHPDHFRGVIAVAARMRDRDTREDRLKRAAGRLAFLVCHSPEDEAIDIAEGKAAHQRLRQAGIDSRLLRYTGGHGIQTS